jgi:hypothetical protein
MGDAIDIFRCQRSPTWAVRLGQWKRLDQDEYGSGSCFDGSSTWCWSRRNEGPVSVAIRPFPSSFRGALRNGFIFGTFLLFLPASKAPPGRDTATSSLEQEFIYRLRTYKLLGAGFRAQGDEISKKMAVLGPGPISDSQLQPCPQGPDQLHLLMLWFHSIKLLLTKIPTE